MEGLEKARLKWTTDKLDDDESSSHGKPYVVDVPLAEFPNIAIRQGGKGEQRYVRELMPGRVEFIADYEIISLFFKNGSYLIGIEIYLPSEGGEKVITSFEGPLLVY